MPNPKKFLKKPSFFSSNADKNTGIDQKIADLCFELLEVPKPDDYSKLKPGTALKKVIGASVNSDTIFDELGEDHFMNYVLVILNIASAGGTTIKKDGKEVKAIEKNFEDLGTLNWLSLPQKVQFKNKLNKAIENGDFLKIDVAATVKQLQENASKVGLQGHAGKFMIYHATTAARADGNYSNEEKESMKKLAKELDVSEEDYDNLQKLVRIQAKLKNIAVSSRNLDFGGKEPTAEEELEELYNSVFNSQVNENEPVFNTNYTHTHK